MKTPTREIRRDTRRRLRTALHNIEHVGRSHVETLPPAAVSRMVRAVVLLEAALAECGEGRWKASP